MMYRRVQLFIMITALLGIGLVAYRYLNLIRPTADVRLDDEAVIELGTPAELSGVDQNTASLEQVTIEDDGTVQLEQIPVSQQSSEGSTGASETTAE